MYRSIFVFVGLLALILIGCSKKTVDSDNEAAPQLYFSPASGSLTVGNTVTLNLNLKDISPSIFALSCELRCDYTLLSFADSLKTTWGGFFGNDAIKFVRCTDSVIYLSITLTRGQSQVTGSGTLFAFELEGTATGSGSVYLQSDKLHFYDSTGAEISLGNIELKTASLLCLSQ